MTEHSADLVVVDTIALCGHYDTHYLHPGAFMRVGRPLVMCQECAQENARRNVYLDLRWGRTDA
jgi:hypothetical protein